MRTNQIYTTSTYDFVFKEANREIDEKSVQHIAKRMSDVGWQGPPIEVSINEKGEKVIEDGQHRYEAAKQTNTPVKFMVVPEKTVYDLAIQNSMSKAWTNKDFVDVYAKQGFSNYKRLRQLMNEFPDIPLTDIIRFFDSENKRKDDLKKGRIRITDEMFYIARENLQHLVILNEALDNAKVRTKSAYSRALIKLLKNGLIDPQRMADKIDKHGAMLLTQSVGTSQAILELDQIYNYHQTKGTVVHFFDKVRSR